MNTTYSETNATSAVDRKVNILNTRILELNKTIALLRDTDNDLRDRISRLNATKIDNKNDAIKDYHIDWGNRHDQVKSIGSGGGSGSGGSGATFYTRTLAMTQNAYVELGSWNIATTGYINKMICINTGKSTDEGAQYYHFCAQKSATGGNWYKVFSIKKQDASGCDLGLEINVDATTASARIYTMRNW